MLEVRYDNNSKLVTGWCGDPTAFGNLEREGHTVVVLDIPIPKGLALEYLYDEASGTLIDNPDFVEPEPARDFVAEIDDLKSRVEKLEKK